MKGIKIKLSISTIKKLPASCWDCPFTDCKLPLSKVLPHRKLMEYTYKRHPKCELQVNKTEAEEQTPSK
jgi:hypothetical protein